MIRASIRPDLKLFQYAFNSLNGLDVHPTKQHKVIDKAKVSYVVCLTFPMMVEGIIILELVKPIRENLLGHNK